MISVSFDDVCFDFRPPHIERGGVLGLVPGIRLVGWGLRLRQQHLLPAGPHGGACSSGTGQRGSGWAKAGVRWGWGLAVVVVVVVVLQQ